MSNYYALVAGLPNIAFDDAKLTYSVAEFRDEIYDVLSSNDRKLIDLFFLKFDNKNLLTYLNHPDAPLDPKGILAFTQLDELVKAMKDGDICSDKAVPPYFIDFLNEYIEDKPQENLSWEDRLASYYYNYAMKSGNKFVNDWFELNLNINNILIAFTCRKYDMEKASYIVGNNEIAEALKNNNSRDFGLSDSVDYFLQLQRIAEEPDLKERERKIDLLKWNWIEENTFFNYFSIERIFAYLLQLEMIERWVSLDKTTGDRLFRKLIQGMKKESLASLEEFKRNNNK